MCMGVHMLWWTCGGHRTEFRFSSSTMGSGGLKSRPWAYTTSGLRCCWAILLSPKSHFTLNSTMFVLLFLSLFSICFAFFACWGWYPGLSVLRMHYHWSLATCFLSLHAWYPGVSMLSAYVFKCFPIFLVYTHFYVTVIKYHDQIHFWNKEFILAYSLEEQASLVAEGMTVSSSQGGRGRKLGDHFFKHIQGAERATWKLDQVMNSQSSIPVMCFLQQGSPEPLEPVRDVLLQITTPASWSFQHYRMSVFVPSQLSTLSLFCFV